MKVDSYHCKALRLSKNKYVEFQISRWQDAKFFEVESRVRGKGEDHSGFTFSFTMFYHEFCFSFYDRRHADVRAKEEP
jgi:hypothetical protein